MAKLKIFQIDAFTNKPYEGNPAAVTFADGLSTAQMQKIAKEMNLSETAFLSRSKKADYKLRWFTPKQEVNLCGHATIASLHFLNENKLLKNNKPVKFETRSGILDCYSKNKLYYMQIPILKMKSYSQNKDAILEALGIKKNQLAAKSPIIMLENGYLFIHVKKLSTLRNLTPNFETLKSFSGKKQLDFTVFTLETIDKKSFVHSRFFAPTYGINEDPVTGSSNGPLLLVLNKLRLVNLSQKERTSLIFEQGDFIGRKGRVRVQFNKKKNELYIAGNAATVMKGEISV